MDLEDLLGIIDRTAANVQKLEQILEQAIEYWPDGPSLGTSPEYEDLRRAWADCIKGLPEIEGWTITEELPDINDMGQAFIDYADIGELPYSVWAMQSKPSEDLAEYRYKLGRARRSAVRNRITEVVKLIDLELPRLLQNIARDSSDVLECESERRLRRLFSEVEVLVGDSPRKAKRWGDLGRHLAFGQGQDWHDIWELDWPEVKDDVIAAGESPFDPLPVPKVDIGLLSQQDLPGEASSDLPWEKLSAADLERVLFDILRSLEHHQNVEWLQKTNAADKGRDLSCERVLDLGVGSKRTERVVVQAKHWTQKSIGVREIADTVNLMRIQPPPVVKTLIFATSGTFTQTAVEWTETWNNKGDAPNVELWPHSRLEALLAKMPGLAAAHGLR
ncbi:restriction endonuclease [uncultured Corynebacterium sp.]|uniref:restriction endonuclease n=1 Tax=uncultured Corynebacterium sp. TaxID=159447 RepID=UPI00288A079E|nr:restriction endonuclease [uncultured Corynebacterium sp.]